MNITQGFDARSKYEEELITSFPEFCDLTGLPSVLAAKGIELEALLGEPEINRTLDNISREASMPAASLHNDAEYTTIRFSDEGVKCEPDTAMSSGFKINVRQVIRGFRKAFRYIGGENADDLDNRPIMKFLDTQYMTVDVDENTVFPALRFSKVAISEEEAQRIRDLIDERRDQLNNPGYIVRADR